MVFIGFGELVFLPSQILGSLPKVHQAEFPFKLKYEIDGQFMEVVEVE